MIVLPNPLVRATRCNHTVKQNHLRQTEHNPVSSEHAHAFQTCQITVDAGKLLAEEALQGGAATGGHQPLHQLQIYC